MTKVLAAYQWKRKGGGPRAKYPWDEWLDGQIREAKAGEHYACSDLSFMQQVAKNAASRRVVCRVERVEPGRIVFQCPYAEKKVK